MSGHNSSLVSAKDLFTDLERKTIVTLTERLTGASPSTQPKIESCMVNIRRRLVATGCPELSDYFHLLQSSTEELAHFISAVTIHTTSWFREAPHFDRLRHIAETFLARQRSAQRGEPFRVLSAGCSSGEEVYSIALVLENLRHSSPDFEYRVEGWDVDPVSIVKAQRGIYQKSALTDIPSQYQKNILIGTQHTEGLFTLASEIRRRCEFYRRSLLSSETKAGSYYDLVFCRNVMIYFGPEAIKQIINNLLGRLSEGGYLCLGHSEAIQPDDYPVEVLGNTTYKKMVEATPKPISVVEQTPKVLTELGKKSVLRRPDLILVGASTGGTETLIKVLQDMPKPCPAVVVVQHIALSFAQPFAQRLAEAAGLRLGLPMHGSIVEPNHLYMAHGDYHIGLRSRGRHFLLEISKDPPMHSVRPSVDHLFLSAAKNNGQCDIAAVILTGMGKDGAKGLAALRNAGANTFAQDEASSIVFGMPKEAIALGAAEFIGPPSAIRQQLFAACALPQRVRSA